MADPLSVPTFIQSVTGVINDVTAQFKSIMNQIMSVTYYVQIISLIVMIGLCAFKFATFVVEFCIWIFYFLKWLILPWPSNFLTPKKNDVNVTAGFICWAIRYIIVIAYKITSLPKCFFWYFLDTAGWVLYLPFKFVFWMLDFILSGKSFQSGEKKVWYFLDEIDYFLHGKPRDNYFMYEFNPKEEAPVLDASGNDIDTMHLGLHIIHFPDSVMNQCYSISPFSLASLASFPIAAFTAFIKCATNPF